MSDNDRKSSVMWLGVTHRADLPVIEYVKNETGPLWCVVHHREAAFIRKSSKHSPVECCDPKLGGIMMPCRVVPLSDAQTTHQQDPEQDSKN